MAKGKKKISRSRADLLNTREEEEVSPFSSVLLREKKIELKPKKPSEIVKGYDPSASFGDILYNYEHTGDPYAMPKRKANASASTNFGAILDKWEGKAKKPEKKTEVPKSQYKATRSFSDILNEYETPKNAVQTKKARGNRSVSSILNGFKEPEVQAPKKAVSSEKAANKEEERPEEVIEAKKEEEIIAPPTFFKKMEEDDERPENVAWSVFGDNKEIVRKESPKEEKKVFEAKRAKYVPTKDFGEILSKYDGERKPEVMRESPKKKEEAKHNPLFKAPKEGEERPEGVKWPIYGDDKSKDKNESELFINSVNGLGEKTFEELMKEKGEMSLPKKEKSIRELRSMLPGATLDLHGLYAAEAEKKINEFIDEALSSGIEKIAIIHGKGLHSENGETVLKDLTTDILYKRHVVRETSVPSAQFGGSGVIWVILKKDVK